MVVLVHALCLQLAQLILEQLRLRSEFLVAVDYLPAEGELVLHLLVLPCPHVQALHFRAEGLQFALVLDRHFCNLRLEGVDEAVLAIRGIGHAQNPLFLGRKSILMQDGLIMLQLLPLFRQLIAQHSHPLLQFQLFLADLVEDRMQFVVLMVELQDLIVHALLLLLPRRLPLAPEHFFDDLLEEFLGFLRGPQHLLDEEIFVLGLHCSLHEQLQQFLHLLRAAAPPDLHQVDLFALDLHSQDVAPESLDRLKQHLEVGESMREGSGRVHHLADADEVFDHLRQLQQESPIGELG